MNSSSVIRLRALSRLARKFSDGGASSSHKAGSPSSTVNENVPGLSEACIKKTTNPVGPDVDPNKCGAYKVPEYFCYNNMSYFEAEIEMTKFRLPQPSALK